ncbi:MAG: tRNA (adenosine(37)-N6)-threonylcarbamoyltransferase complex transferase subunit TsaD, partial [Candidatus Omnitrophota bacterium]
PIIGVDHLHAHIASCFLGKGRIEEMFPFIGVVVSGGHTSIYDCGGLDEFTVIGRTKDDAAGEAYDKVAKVLELGYPGGPVVEKRAREYNGREAIRFPRAFLRDRSDLDFSFSGLKTAVLYHWRDSRKTGEEKDKICFSFQEAVIDVLDKKISRAVRMRGARTLAVGGGVINNGELRRKLISRAREERIELYLPEEEYCGDNAAMVAFLGEGLFNAGLRSDLLLNAKTTGE